MGSSDLATQILINQCTEADDLGLFRKSDTWEGTRDTGWDRLCLGCCTALTPLGPWGFCVSMHRFSFSFPSSGAWHTAEGDRNSAKPYVLPAQRANARGPREGDSGRPGRTTSVWCPQDTQPSRGLDSSFPHGSWNDVSIYTAGGATSRPRCGASAFDGHGRLNAFTPSPLGPAARQTLGSRLSHSRRRPRPCACHTVRNGLLPRHRGVICTERAVHADVHSLMRADAGNPVTASPARGQAHPSPPSVPAAPGCLCACVCVGGWGHK